MNRAFAFLLLTAVVLTGCSWDVQKAANQEPVAKAEPASKPQPEVVPTTPTTKSQLPTSTTNKPVWKTDGEINYKMISRGPGQSVGDSELNKEIKPFIESLGYKVDKIMVEISTIDGQRQGFVVFGNLNGMVTTEQAIELHAKIEKKLAGRIDGLKLGVLWWNKGDGNTYSIQMNNFSNRDQLEVANWYTGEGVGKPYTISRRKGL